MLQFGPGEMQQHGFGRNVEWSVGSTSADLQPDERDPSIELVLSPSEYSDAMFPYKFKVVYTVTLHGEDLQTMYRCVCRPCCAAHITNSVSWLALPVLISCLARK